MSTSTMCPVCYDPCTLFLQCCHPLCEACMEKVMKRTRKCPTCSNPITSTPGGEPSELSTEEEEVSEEFVSHDWCVACHAGWCEHTYSAHMDIFKAMDDPDQMLMDLESVTEATRDPGVADREVLYLRRYYREALSFMTQFLDRRFRRVAVESQRRRLSLHQTQGVGARASIVPESPPMLTETVPSTLRRRREAAEESERSMRPRIAGIIDLVDDDSNE